MTTTVTRLLVSLIITIVFMVLVYNPIPSAYSQDHTTTNDNYKIEFNNISSNIGDSVYPQIAAYENNVYVVWQDNNFAKNYKNYDVLFKKSTNSGAGFEEIVNLSNNNGFSEHTQITAYENNVYVVWADNDGYNNGPANREVLFKASTNGGASFGDTKTISSNIGDSHNQEISIFEDNVYVVWLNHSSDRESSILFKASTNGGASFGDTKTISTNAGKLSYPKVAAYENNVYVVWNSETLSSKKNNGGVLFAKSTDNGNTFGNVVRLNSDENFGETQIAAYENNVYVVWGSSVSSSSSSHKNVRTDDGSIFFTKSTDNGNTFGNIDVIADNFRNPQNVEILTHESNVHITWQGSLSTNENEEILIKTSYNRGIRFDNMKNISNNEGISECPSIAVSRQNGMHLLWEDDTPGNHEILSSKIMYY
jgi:hypothetical protein